MKIKTIELSPEESGLLIGAFLGILCTLIVLIPTLVVTGHLK